MFVLLADKPTTTKSSQSLSSVSHVEEASMKSSRPQKSEISSSLGQNSLMRLESNTPPKQVPKEVSLWDVMVLGSVE